MFIKQSELRSAAASHSVFSESVTTKTASAQGRTTVFLSHSHRDRELAKGLRVYLKRRGWNVYIDWLDEEMPARISKETAARLQSKIQECNRFMLLATENSCRHSRWCPWEIGYADGKKPRNAIVIVPTSDDRGHEYGSEYLGLYERIENMGPNHETALMPPAGDGRWIKSLR